MIAGDITQRGSLTTDGGWLFLLGILCSLVPMEQMMATLLLALKEVETDYPDSKARKTLQKAVDQAIRMREKWKCNWGLQN